MGRNGDSVEVRANSDVIDASDFDDVIEVGDQGIEWSAADSGGELAVDLVGDVERNWMAAGFVRGSRGGLRSSAFFALSCPCLAPVLIDEGREEVDHDYAVVFCYGSKHFVGEVAVGLGECASRGMGGDDGSAGEADYVPEGFVGGVGDVDHHAEAVHLFNDLFAEGGEAVVAENGWVVDVAGGVGPVVGVGPGEGHVACAEAVIVPEASERVLDGVAAFDADEDA